MRLKVGRIYETRIAGATEDSFKKVMRQIQQRERQAETYTQGATHARHRLPMSPAEQEALDAQAHLEFSEMEPAQQAKLMNEIGVMWGQIPEHLREKAKDVKGWKAKVKQ